jgi:acyl-CoA dehydrogenase
VITFTHEPKALPYPTGRALVRLKLARCGSKVTVMDFAMSAKAQDYHKRLSAFMTEFVFPAEAEYERYRVEKGPHDHSVPPVIEELKTLARERGLWNLFLPAVSGLTNTDYAPLAELTGWSLEIAPEVTNCAAPDTGNMETLHLFATEQQRKQWLEPLLAGEIRSAFSMTEPAVASSDARNIETSIVRDSGDYVINGRKWWTSGAADPRCKILIVMGRTNPEAASHQQQSMVLVPIDTPGVTVVRSTPVFGWQDQHGHCEVSYDNVRVPVENLLGEEGSGFAIAQARLGPGRIHHCMRALGAAERALALMVDRARNRVAFGRPLADQGVVRESIAKSRNEIDQARLLCEKAAWTIDQEGNKAAHLLVSQIKAVAPKVACDVIDRAIQVHGAAGVSDDTPLARLYSWHRAMRIFDGPDEVHMRTVARVEIGREKSAFAAATTADEPLARRATTADEPLARRATM